MKGKGAPDGQGVKRDTDTAASRVHAESAVVSRRGLQFASPPAQPAKTALTQGLTAKGQRNEGGRGRVVWYQEGHWRILNGFRHLRERASMIEGIASHPKTGGCA